MEKSKYKNKN